MKSPLFLIIAGLGASLMLNSVLYAESGDTVTDTPSVIEIESPLLVDTISTEDDSHVTVVFNQAIIRESVRVRIAKQSDESNVRIESFTGGADTNTVSVILADTLAPDTAYKMTIISAISEDGIIIKDGADGIKEFSTPLDLAKYEVASTIVLNAPNNPNAVLIGSSGTVASTGTNLPQPATVTVSETTDELPLTGMDSTIFIIIAATLGLILILRRRII